MQLKEFDILIDIKKHNKIDYIEVVQGDFETNILNIKLISGLNNFNLAGASVEIAFSKPDGTTVIQDQANGVAILNESEGKIQCILNTNTIAREGRVIAEVRVFEGTKLLTSSRFEFWVRKAIVNDETIESTNEFPLLQRLTDDVQGIISTESTRVTAEDERKTAETNRKNAENARVAAEQQRATTFAGYETRVSTVEDDLIAHKEDYAIQTSKIKKELNDYKATMGMVNINQEAKQSVKGYSTVSLPPNAANGQISASVKGLTATNLVKNSKGNTLDGWNHQYVTIENDYLKMNTSNNFRLVQNSNYMANHKYYFTCKYKHITSDYNIHISLTDDGSIVTYVTITEINNTFTRFSRILTPTRDANDLRVYRGSGTGGDFALKEIIIIDLTTTFGSGNEPTVEECDIIFANWFDGTKSTISASRLKSVSEDETQESVMYLPNVGELRSLPNGTKDEVRVSGGKAELVKRTKDVILDANKVTGSIIFNANVYRTIIENINPSPLRNGYFIETNQDGKYERTTTAGSEVRSIWILDLSRVQIFIEKSKVDAMIGVTALERFKAYLNQYPITLTYQLAEPIITPIEVSGNLVSYPSGTVYVEKVVADAGIYNNGITTQYADLPIKTVDKLIKYDFETGVQTSLDASKSVINANKLSFTHPDLVNGDMVFFDYYYDVESTEGEVEIEYYDSRYTIKDTTNGKHYKWDIKSTNGVGSVVLTEV